MELCCGIRRDLDRIQRRGHRGSGRASACRDHLRRSERRSGHRRGHPDRGGNLPTHPAQAGMPWPFQSPVGFFMRHWRSGAVGAFQMGLSHGEFCVGCCWMLMALLFVAGVMNLAWVAALSAFVLLEKLTRWPRVVAR